MYVNIKKIGMSASETTLQKRPNDTEINNYRSPYTAFEGMLLLYSFTLKYLRKWLYKILTLSDQLLKSFSIFTTSIIT